MLNPRTKRLFDLLLAAVGTVLVAPLAALTAVLIVVTSRVPPFFTQVRIGRGGVPFRCTKFRTMRPDSEGAGTITSATDDRVTCLGRVLRRLKLDELPQLWNVLIGRMSFVGPRPDVPGYADCLTGDARRILELRPGITGPASLYFRREEELLAQVEDPKTYNDTVLWPRKVQLNLEYLDSWSFWKDIGYIFVTVIPGLNRVLKLVPEPPRRPEDVLGAPEEIRTLCPVGRGVWGLQFRV